MEPTAPDWRTIGGASAPVGARGGPERTLSLPRNVVAILGVSLFTLLLGATAAFLVMPTTGGVVIDAPDTGAATFAEDEGGSDPGMSTDTTPSVRVGPRLLMVDVEGAVARPGLVQVAVGARVGDALRSAGGYAADADLVAAADVLNLAQEVTDGLKIVVPAMGDARPDVGTGMPTGSAARNAPLDLNHATEPELDGLPGVGPATVAKIVAARAETPFRSIDELRARGIVGEATFSRLRDLVTVGR